MAKTKRASTTETAPPTQLYNQRLLTWRQTLNPLSGLFIQRWVQMQQNSAMGYFADIQWLYTFIERRDAILKAVLERRLAAIKKLNWAVKIKPGKEKDATAKKQQKFLECIYNNIDNIRDAVEHLALATFRGYAHLEKHFDEDGMVNHLEPVPQYLWCRKLPVRDWLYNAKAFQTATGVPIDTSNFLIRENERPTDEIASLMFIRKAMSQKDWDCMIETFGIPPVFITLPQGVGSGSPAGTAGNTILDAYQEIADRIMSDGRGVLPFGANVVAPTKELTGEMPFEKHLRYCDEQIVLAGTSGLLTSLSAPTGMNDSQGDAHQSTFYDLAKAEARSISEIFQKQMDNPLLEEEFGDVEPMAFFDLAHNDIEDADPIDDASKLSTAGYQIDVDELSEKTGYTLTLKPQPGAMGGMGAPSQDGASDYGSDYSQEEAPYSGGDSYADWIGNVMSKATVKEQQLIRNILSMPDREMQEHLLRLEKSLAA